MKVDLKPLAAEASTAVPTAGGGTGTGAGTTGTGAGGATGPGTTGPGTTGPGTTGPGTTGPGTTGRFGTGAGAAVGCCAGLGVLLLQEKKINFVKVAPLILVQGQQALG